MTDDTPSDELPKRLDSATVTPSEITKVARAEGYRLPADAEFIDAGGFVCPPSEAEEFIRRAKSAGLAESIHIEFVTSEEVFRYPPRDPSRPKPTGEPFVVLDPESQTVKPLTVFGKPVIETKDVLKDCRPAGYRTTYSVFGFSCLMDGIGRRWARAAFMSSIRGCGFEPGGVCIYYPPAPLPHALVYKSNPYRRKAKSERIHARRLKAENRRNSLPYYGRNVIHSVFNTGLEFRRVTAE